MRLLADLALLSVLAAGVAVPVGGVLLIVWAERRQTERRARLAVAPMHQHDGRPCYGADCAPARYTADPWKDAA